MATDARCIGYVGLPGAGKSHTLVKSVIIPALQAGRTVYTNIPLQEDTLAAIHGITDTQMKGLRCYPDENDETGALVQPLAKLYLASEDQEINVLQNCVVVHDEIQTSFPAEMRGTDSDLARFREWLSHHRHYSADVHWGSQSETFVIIQLRRLTGLVYDFQNLRDNKFKNIGSRYGRYRQRMYMM